LKAEYSAPIRHHDFSFMFLPADTNRQQISELQTEFSDEPKCGSSTDGFGNGKLYGHIEKEHDSFEIKVCGRARTGLDIYEEYTENSFISSLFKAQTELTLPGESLNAYHAGLESDPSEGVYDKTLRIMRALHDTYEYASGVTEAHESAENAFSMGKGVCQDFAHIMLSLLRKEGIPARYVTGMMIGEGASHAWVEVLCNGYWYGFDPTNNKLVDDDYIRVSCGRDSSDCAIIRGVFYGIAEQTQSEQVTVEENG
jgi:transglutaminase-like putative cysteine protease